jgi:hypothetical protein
MGVVLNPQQLKFKEAYCNPDSPTFGNKLQSALVAGYTREYAESIGAKDNLWMADIVGDQEMLTKAEKVLHRTLDLPLQTTEDGRIDSSFLRVQADVAKFAAETIGKAKYSKQSNVDHTTGGEPFKVDVISFKPKE